MPKSIISLIILCCCWVTVASAATTADLSPGAPDRYVVVRGDTLWGISSRFLKDPWRWPELWQLNRDQIKNPNRIYPGDVLVLDKSQQELRLRLLKMETVKVQPQMYVEKLQAEPIPVIPTADIAPFLSQPLVTTQDEFSSAPRIVRTQENRVALGAGSIAYVQGITKEQGALWQIFRPGDPLVDPVSNETLGYEAIYLGDAKVTKFGDVSTVEITKSPLEIYAGDYLLPAPRTLTPSNYLPHAPDKKIDARIIAAYGGLYEVGNMAIVVISKGTRDGLEVGNVLAIYRNLNSPVNRLRESPLYGRTGFIYNEDNPKTNYVNEPLGTRNSPVYGRVGIFAGDYLNDNSALPSVTLPDERYALMLVFRVFDRASYALILNSDRPVNISDIATNP